MTVLKKLLTGRILGDLLKAIIEKNIVDKINKYSRVLEVS